MTTDPGESAASDTGTDTGAAGSAAPQTAGPQTAGLQTAASQTATPRTAADTARRVRAGELSPVDAVHDALARIEAADRTLGTFRTVRVAAALREAQELGKRPDLADLPLAGVPVAVKDVLAVEGESVRIGSAATPQRPRPHDDELVRRLRAAGAVVVGITSVPELCIFPTTDSAFGTTRNPWNPERTPGGSSGGSAAAVASGMVPVAHGTDGLGSIRIPAANCGLFGIKPGRGLLPAEGGAASWYGMSESGPLATTVEDAALMLSVLADRPSLAEIGPADGLRIGVCAGTPSPVTRLDPHLAEALERTADALAGAGHAVQGVRVPYPRNPIGMLARWTRGPAGQAAGLDRSLLARRTRTHAALGRLVERFRLVREGYVDAIEADMAGLFSEVDLVLTPTLLRTCPPARRWSEASWLANAAASIRYASYPGVWNMLGWPAASVPAGTHPVDGMPIGVQIVGAPGAEVRILALAGEVERLRPWRRTCPDRAGEHGVRSR